ncbi:MAG TPA: Fic family protein [Candidatus Avisuccinivibrio pullicola]|nr:Fic family protein [Candidatus Avisuccinivibrio pullicola]
MQENHDFALLMQMREEYRRLMEGLDTAVRDDYIKSLSFSFTHNTVAIEGNRSTVLDAEMILRYSTLPNNMRLCDVLDIVASSKAVELLYELSEIKQPVTESVICKFHRAALYPARFAGIYRNFNVRVQNSITSVADYTEIFSLMKRYAETLRENRFADPLEKAAYTHCEFVRIHPFPDGNGRTARLIMNLSLMNDGFPMLDIRSGTSDIQIYMDAIQSYCQGEGITAFRQFLSKALTVQMESFIRDYHNASLNFDIRKLKGVLFVKIMTADSNTELAVGRIEGARYNAPHDVWIVPVSERERVEALRAVGVYADVADFLAHVHN